MRHTVSSDNTARRPHLRLDGDDRFVFQSSRATTVAQARRAARAARAPGRRQTRRPGRRPRPRAALFTRALLTFVLCVATTGHGGIRTVELATLAPSPAVLLQMVLQKSPGRTATRTNITRVLAGPI